MKPVTVITGGAGGMGKAIARELGKGKILVLADTSQERLETVAGELQETGYDVRTFVVDVTDRSSVEALAKFAADLGPVTQIIHTAGVSPALCPADKIFQVNSLGTVNMTEAFYNVIAEGGVMINFASVAAHQTQTEDAWLEVYEDYDKPDFFEKLMDLVKDMAFDEFLHAGQAYAISKRFVIYYSQMNVARFAEKGARILSVSPGSYLTPMHQALIDNQPDMAEDQLDLIPCGRWGHPYEMASLIHFLCSPGAAYISGVDILADGGEVANIFVPQIGED